MNLLSTFLSTRYTLGILGKKKKIHMDVYDLHTQSENLERNCNTINTLKWILMN